MKHNTPRFVVTPLGVILSLILLTLTACQSTPPATPTPNPQSPISSPTPNPQSPTTSSPTPAGDPIRELTILYTNDEHGWMEGMAEGEGAANLVGLWREVEGYHEDGPFLILSGGDLWTGPAISTWFEGESMTEVLNAMGYQAAAVGNHEFDFGLSALQRRAAQATFPLLSANIRYQDNGRTPTELGIQPYTVLEANGIQVGLIGLTTTSTPVTTNPVTVSEFDFLNYQTALREVVPQARAAGAELLLVLSHVCQDELKSLAAQIADLNIHMLGGGHCNERFAEERNGIILIEGGYHLTSYARVTFTFDTATDTVIEATYDTYPNEGGPADPTVAAIVGRWQEEAEAELNQVIGYTQAGIPRRSPTMQTLITESWLLSYPFADVALTNTGGIRAAIPPGEITLGNVIGVMPFNNVIVELQLTGAELLQVLGRSSNLAIGGIHTAGANWLLNETGAPIDPNTTYHVLVNDFMYAGGDGFTMLARFDPNGYNTAIDWRQPVIDWIQAQNSTAANPLDPAIAQLGTP